MGKNVGILAVDFYVPPTVKTNQDLLNAHGPFYSSSGRIIDAEGIFKRTGIKKRHLVTNEDNSDLAAKAAIRIIEKSKIPPPSIDGCIVATTTPSMFFPSTACLMQDKLRRDFPDMKLVACFDLSAACAGSTYGLIVAKSLVDNGTCQNVLVIGTEVLSKICRWQYKGNEVINGQKQRGDWETSVLFGDKAAGVLVGEVPAPRGFLAVDWGADGSLWKILRSDGFGTQFPGVRTEEPHLFLNGTEVYKQAVLVMAEVAERVVAKADISWQEVKRVILHQANGRITESIARRLEIKGLPAGRVPSNIDRYGNTSSASPFSLLTEEENAGEIEQGDLLVISTVGAGLTWAACLLRF